MTALARDGGLLLWLFLRNPLALALLALLVAVLHGALRAMGLPSLFWNHRPLHRFLAGLAVTLLALEAILTTFAIAGDPSGAGDLGSLAAWAGGGWALALTSAVLLRLWHDRRPAASSPSSGRLRLGRLAPAIWGVGEHGPTVPIVERVRVREFVAGAAVGEAVLAVVVVYALPLVATWLARRNGAANHSPLLCAVGILVVAGATILLTPARSTPAIAICFFAGAILVSEAGLVILTHSGGAATLIVLLALVAGGAPRFKLRIPELADHYSEPEKYPPRRRSAPPDGLLPFDAPCAALGTAGPEPLVIVCASGGGLRAATWTAGILEQMDRSPEFRAAVRLVVGASGGMVGAGCWVANRLRAGSGSPDAGSSVAPPFLLHAVGGLDSLGEIARGLVYRDIPLAFLPLRNTRDRGRRLADSWEARMRELGLELGVPISGLKDAELAGTLPFLAFSPMMVEDGRRFLIANLDLTEVTDQNVRWLSSTLSPHAPTTGLASRTAYHAAEVLADDWRNLRLSTAMRLSAAFPYVSPAVLLPTRPRRRVVDAGYFDNYGLELACGWLRHLLLARGAPWVKERISAVLIIQIRDNVSTLSVNPDTVRDFRRLRGETSSPLARGLEGLSSPPEGMLAARESVALFRNDALVRAVSDLYAGAFDPDFVTTTVFEFAGEAALSWVLSPGEVGSIEDQVLSYGIRGKAQAILDWLAQKSPAARAHSA
jgi:hypothetical protein